MDPQSQEDLAISMATKLASYTSRASMGVVVIGGVVRLIFYTRLMWLDIIFAPLSPNLMHRIY